MENLETVKYVVKQGDWFTKLDLQDAHLTVPIRQECQKFLCISWKKKLFKFKCLPFGLSPAPRCFTKIMKPVIAGLRRLGVRLIVYLDDFLIMHESEQGANEHFKLVSNVLQNLGFLINWDKSTAVSCQSIEFLGMLISSEGMSFTLPSEKVHRVHSIGRGLLKSKLPSLRDLSIYLGHLAWAIQAVPYTQAHYRLSQNFF